MKRSVVVDSLILLLLLALTIGIYFYSNKQNSAAIMASDVVQLADIFERIDKQAGIVSFDENKNPINFLTIKKDGFTGSQVGPMLLAHPQLWQGPYVDENPTMQGKEYQIIQTQRGYFILPGDGVKLPNGLIIGKDINIDHESNVACLLNEKGEDATVYKGYSLIAGPIHFTGGTLRKLTPFQEQMAEELV